MMTVTMTMTTTTVAVYLLAPVFQPIKQTSPPPPNRPVPRPIFHARVLCRPFPPMSLYIISLREGERRTRTR